MATPQVRQAADDFLDLGVFGEGDQANSQRGREAETRQCVLHGS
jgi:hypothetical protein